MDMGGKGSRFDAIVLNSVSSKQHSAIGMVRLQYMAKPLHEMFRGPVAVSSEQTKIYGGDVNGR